MKVILKIVLCGALLIGAGPAVRAEPRLVDGVVARVNEHAITGGDVADAAQPVLQQVLNTSKAEDRPAKLRKAYEEVLNSLIERQLILDAYNKREQKLPEWAIDERIAEIVRDSFQDDRGNLMMALSKGKTTFEEWRSQVKDHIVVAAVRGDRVERHTRVSPQAVREAYDKNPDKYRKPDTVWLRLIVLRRGSSVEDVAAKRQQADDIKKRLGAGEDFASLAKARSEDSRAENGGDWGWIEPRMLRPELAQVVAALKPSDVSGIIETKDELYIVKLEDRKGGTVSSFEEAQPAIERELRQAEAGALYDAWIDALKKAGYVKVFDIAPHLAALLP